MSRKSVLSRYANGLVEPELPLRAYFLSVGGALLLLLLAADWVLPAPLPSRLTDSHSALPPIRIHSELRGPEAVVIDTSGIEPLPAPTEHHSAEAPSQQPEPEVAGVVTDVGDGRPAAATTDLRLRESLAQLQPAVQEQAGRGGRPHQITTRWSKLAQARARKLRRSARHPGFQASRYALVPN
ncbi:hypothetical protein GWG65_28780 [Bradyrhizobium sp. CSA207]|uniref:hypothetical protein n=1 Tax=Bradyrhizobium sp. CSA207 TaxID=2698826 RepID=UPI0023B0D4CB|nr:hypothetical protein [Bradyrhizobium sp. CSA207]MDE5445357.1 hypothetical protein [Bradyrhizobium sp. CSA207]